VFIKRREADALRTFIILRKSLRVFVSMNNTHNDDSSLILLDNIMDMVRKLLKQQGSHLFVFNGKAQGRAFYIDFCLSEAK